MSATLPDTQDLRHEIKFVTYASERARILNWLQLQPACFSVPYPPRHINNVYFDTFDYRAYAENLAGISQRKKLRYRWYGEGVGPDRGVMELKLKRNHFGWKQRFAINEPPWQAGLSWREVVEAMRAAMPMLGQLWLDQNPLPVLLNRYRREYFVTANDQIRATLDSDQRIFDQRRNTYPNFETAGITEDTIVLEFKFPITARKSVEQLLKHIPIRIGRHSKYMNAMRALSFG